MNLSEPTKVINNENTSVNMNVQFYKLIGSLNFYKYTLADTHYFKCTNVIEYPEYVFFSGNNNNNNNKLSPTTTSQVSNDMCIMIDNKYCHSNRSYYNDIVKHIFVNNDTFYANDVCNLAEYIVRFPLKMTHVNRMLSTIYLQYQLLVESGYSISYIDPEDILVICTQEEGDCTLFFFSNYEKIYKINTIGQGMTRGSNDSIDIIHFYDHDNFVLPPELVENVNIPFTCHKSSWLYSLACVVLYCLNPITRRNDLGMEHDKHDSIIKQVSEYKGTKLYYTLLYCLSKEPCKRQFILF